MGRFRGLRIHEDGNGVRTVMEDLSLDDLSPGDVVVRAAYSDINYKDALAATGMAKILRHYPLVGGIDVSGTVQDSSDTRLKPDDPVLVCGCGLSETRDGGYAEYVRVPAECVVPLPESLSLHDAMAIGTAGFTAALAIERMERNGQRPELGPILVNGATGGVGSIAIDLFSGAGYEVTAYTGKADAADYLRGLGAAQILLRDDVDSGKRPLEKAQWGGAVDNLGGDPLAWLTRTVKPFGNIASIGLAAGHELHTTVMPFILRAVSLLGIHSVDCPPADRLRAWERLGSDLKPRHLDRIVARTISFDELPKALEDHLRTPTIGRTVVQIGEDR